MSPPASARAEQTTRDVRTTPRVAPTPRGADGAARHPYPRAKHIRWDCSRPRARMANRQKTKAPQERHRSRACRPDRGFWLAGTSLLERGGSGATGMQRPPRPGNSKLNGSPLDGSKTKFLTVRNLITLSAPTRLSCQCPPTAPRPVYVLPWAGAVFVGGRPVTGPGRFITDKSWWRVPSRLSPGDR